VVSQKVRADLSAPLLQAVKKKPIDKSRSKTLINKIYCEQK